VLSDEGSVPIAAREEIEAAFEGAAETYRAQGLVAVRPTLVASEALSERLLFVAVRCGLPRRAGSQRAAKRRHRDSLD
jgi:hypothetical protein